MVEPRSSGRVELGAVGRDERPHGVTWRREGFRSLTTDLRGAEASVRVTQVGSVVPQLLWKLVLVGRFWRHHFSVFGVLQHGAVPVVGSHRSQENAVLEGRKRSSR